MEINKKEKDKIMLLSQNRRPKPSEGVIWPVLDSLGGKVDGFKVGGEVDYHW